MIISKLPTDVECTATSYYFSAHCYRYLEQYDKAKEYYEAVVDNWFDFKYAGEAQSWVGNCLQELVKRGVLSKIQADPEIERAYMAVVENYPDCSVAGYAYLKLAQINDGKGRSAEAVACFEQVLSRPNMPEFIKKDVTKKVQELRAGKK